MRFLADESCDFAAARALRAAGHDVAVVADVAPAAIDEDVAGLAVAEERILLTEDRDFGRLVFAHAVESAGVIYIRFPVGARASLGRSVVQFVEQFGEQLRGRFAVLQPGRARIVG